MGSVIQGSRTVTDFLYKGEDLTMLEVSLMRQVNMEDLELGEEFLQAASLHDLKAEASRWHQASNSVVDSLFEMEALMREIEKKDRDEGLSPTEARVGPDHPFSGKSLAELQTFIKVTKWRIQQLRAGSRLWAYAYFEKYTGQCHNLWTTSILTNPATMTSSSAMCETVKKLQHV